MKPRLSRPLSSLSVAAALALTPLAASAQDTHKMEGGQGHMMGRGMGGGQDHMMGGGMRGGGTDHTAMMSHMMSMMQERLSHTADRIASLKSELKITEAQMPAWTKFADALLAASKSMQESIEGMQHEMMQHEMMAHEKMAHEKMEHEKMEHGATAAEGGQRNYPDFAAIKKTAGAETQPVAAKGLPDKLAHRVEMIKQRLANLQSIKEALDPLYASFSDEQKKIADGLKVSPMGLM